MRWLIRSIKPPVKRAIYLAMRTAGLTRRARAGEIARGRLPAHILAYHRVMPECRPSDGLTVRLSLFRRQLEMLARTHRVLPLGEMIDRIVSGEPFREPLVSITFDDGYEDNHRWAARALAERGLPACFFVTAGYVGTDLVFPWDREAGVAYPMMSWDQVRELSAMGFEIGAHTVHHPDLGRCSAEEVEKELTGSRERIAAEIGKAPDLFAYPFGGRDNFRPELAGVVRDAGFRCCLSAHGGRVMPGEDPFRLRRLPVSPYNSRPADLRLELEGVFARGIFTRRATDAE